MSLISSEKVHLCEGPCVRGSTWTRAHIAERTTIGRTQQSERRADGGDAEINVCASSPEADHVRGDNVHARQAVDLARSELPVIHIPLAVVSEGLVEVFRGPLKLRLRHVPHHEHTRLQHAVAAPSIRTER